MIDLKSIASEVTPLILHAGEMIRDAWDNHTITTHLKDERDIVTDTDTEVEEYLRKHLSRVLPQAGFIVEEGKTQMMGEYNWTIDPIDGTKYFAAQVALFFTQVALLKNGEPVLCFIYNPITKQLLHAVKDGGSYVNAIKMSKRPDLSLTRCIAHFDLGSLSGKNNSWKYTILRRIAENTYRTRVTAGYLAPYLPLGVIDISVNTAIDIPFSYKNMTDLLPHRLFIAEAGYNEALIDIDTHKILIWASSKHITELKNLLIKS